MFLFQSIIRKTNGNFRTVFYYNCFIKMSLKLEKSHRPLFKLSHAFTARRFYSAIAISNWISLVNFPQNFFKSFLFEWQNILHFERCNIESLIEKQCERDDTKYHRAYFISQSYMCVWCELKLAVHCAASNESKGTSLMTASEHCTHFDKFSIKDVIESRKHLSRFKHKKFCYKYGRQWYIIYLMKS